MKTGDDNAAAEADIRVLSQSRGRGGRLVALPDKITIDNSGANAAGLAAYKQESGASFETIHSTGPSAATGRQMPKHTARHALTDRTVLERPVSMSASVSRNARHASAYQ